MPVHCLIIKRLSAHLYDVYCSIFVVFFEKCLLNELYATNIMNSVTEDNIS